MWKNCAKKTLDNSQHLKIIAGLVSLSRRAKMKAGCSIVEKPEGGGGEQKFISDGSGMSLSGSCPLVFLFPLGLS